MEQYQCSYKHASYMYLSKISPSKVDCEIAALFEQQYNLSN